MWRLIVFSVCVKHAPRRVGDCALASASRPTEEDVNAIRRYLHFLLFETLSGRSAFIRLSLSLRFNASLAAVASRPAVALREGWSAKEATDQRFNAAKPNFPRKGSKNFTQYLSERPEMTTQ
jgi:hypothetical protein